jgi:hypothetical protein
LLALFKGMSMYGKSVPTVSSFLMTCLLIIYFFTACRASLAIDLIWCNCPNSNHPYLNNYYEGEALQGDVIQCVFWRLAMPLSRTWVNAYEGVFIVLPKCFYMYH